MSPDEITYFYKIVSGNINREITTTFSLSMGCHFSHEKDIEKLPCLSMIYAMMPPRLEITTQKE